MTAILFDLDGTLIDSIELILESFRHTHREHFGCDKPDAYWLNGIGRTLRDHFAEIARGEDEVQALIETYRDHNLAHHDAMVKPYPGAADTVRTLHAQGVPMALVTSKMRVGADAGVRLLGLESEFSVRICADDVTRGKPDPMPVLQALEALGVSADDAIFVGDSPHDMESGNRAGVRTAAALWGPYSEDTLRAHTPTHWLKNIRDVLTLSELRSDT